MNEDQGMLRLEINCSKDSPRRAIFLYQFTHRRNGHQDRAADIPGLPLHPVSLGRIQDVVALADGLVIVLFSDSEQVAGGQLFCPQMSMKADMAKFMGKRGPQTIL